MTKLTRPKLSALDWAQAALNVIEDKGLNALAVEPLAKKLGVTKGSFYWHYKNLNELIAVALEQWEEGNTHLRLATFDKEIDPKKRLYPLFTEFGSQTLRPALFLKIAASNEHPLVSPVLERVNKKRIELLSKAYKDLGQNPTQALNNARLLYSAYIGYIHFLKQCPGTITSEADRKAYLKYVFEVLIK